tara:strand:+ start:422 stop:628 length:207 start_codon:yes stop_codon:yes gene_type:complete
MDFKPEKYRKGELVKYFKHSDSTLGIVVGQDGSKVVVQWVSWPGFDGHAIAFRGPVPMYKVKRAEAQV